jgi:hypothetical protein
MTATQDSIYKNTTDIDLLLAEIYYPILVTIAKSKDLITYKDLVDHAKKLHPNDLIVQNAIPVSTGRRLDAVRKFTSKNDLPDLTSLVVNQSKGECGEAYLKHKDPEVERSHVYSYDWSKTNIEFNVFLELVKKEIKPRKKVKPEQARKLMSDYYQEHKPRLNANIVDYREIIIEMISEGFSPEEAFQEAPLLSI